MRGTFKFARPAPVGAGEETPSEQQDATDGPATAPGTPRRSNNQKRVRGTRSVEITEDDVESFESFKTNLKNVDGSKFKAAEKLAVKAITAVKKLDSESVSDVKDALEVLQNNSNVKPLVEQVEKDVAAFNDLQNEPLPPPPKAVVPSYAPPPQAAAGPSPTVNFPPPLAAENSQLRSITNDLNDILSRAMQPALTFIGQVAVKLRENDVRNLLAWHDDPKISMIDRLKVVQYAPTVEEFVQLNRELGSDFLGFYLESRLPAFRPRFAGAEAGAKEEPLEAQLPFNLDVLEQQDARSTLLQARQKDINDITNDIVLLRARFTTLSQNEKDDLARLEKTLELLQGMQLLAVSDLELQFAPAWAFEAVNHAIFRRIWSTTSLAAVEAAAQAVNRIPNCSKFTIKELISSPGVSDQFAFLVSASYLNSGDGIPPAQNKGGRGGNRNSTYINVMTMRQLLAQKIYTANIWFETCVTRRANTRLLSLFDEETKKVLAGLQGVEKEERRRKFEILKSKLPQYELVYRE